jgi:hypothetical protein
MMCGSPASVRSPRVLALGKARVKLTGPGGILH